MEARTIRLTPANGICLQADAHLQIPQLREHHPYAVADQGFGLRGQPFNITVAWNIMPYVGDALPPAVDNYLPALPVPIALSECRDNMHEPGAPALQAS